MPMNLLSVKWLTSQSSTVKDFLNLRLSRILVFQFNEKSVGSRAKRFNA
jgi:hypothetical protein